MRGPAVLVGCGPAMEVQLDAPSSGSREGIFRSASSRQARHFSRSSVALVACTAICTAAATYGILFRALRATPGAFTQSPPSLPRRNLRLPRQRCATSALAPSATQPPLWPIFEPDDATQGKLRALGRLLRITGDKLFEVSPTDAPVSDCSETCFKGLCALRFCATSLRDVADSLLQHNWAQADIVIGSARTQCSSLFPQEHLATLQGLLTASTVSATPIGTPQEALSALSRVLEGHADRLSKTCEPLQDALFDASGALQAAARLFATPKISSVAREESSIDALGVGLGLASRMPTLDEISRAVARVADSKRKQMLRVLARQYHPDRHLGREMEVLPIFLHVQKLREAEPEW